MFVPASRQFSLSAETKAQIKAHTEGYRGSARASLLQAARKAREQFQNQWLDFSPGAPLLAKKRHFDVQTDGWVEEQVLIQLDTAAFGKGAVRECFRMKEVRLDTRLLTGSPQRSKKGEDGNTSSTQERRLSFEVLARGLMELPRSGHRTLWVAKRSIADHQRKIMHRRECEMDVIHQTFAKHYAELFNQDDGL
ncbi:Eef2k [Symbiodinium sp. CCMP2592]|nr:Eef2k [Symbiodinium sp. CCMP2592]